MRFRSRRRDYPPSRTAASPATVLRLAPPRLKNTSAGYTLVSSIALVSLSYCFSTFFFFILLLLFCRDFTIDRHGAWLSYTWCCIAIYFSLTKFYLLIILLLKMLLVVFMIEPLKALHVCY